MSLGAGRCNCRNCAAVKGAIAHHFRQLEALLRRQHAGETCIGQTPCCAHQPAFCSGTHQHSLCQYHGNATSAYSSEVFLNHPNPSQMPVDNAILEALQSLSAEQSRRHSVQTHSQAGTNPTLSFPGEATTVPRSELGGSHNDAYPTPNWTPEHLSPPRMHSDLYQQPPNMEPYSHRHSLSAPQNWSNPIEPSTHPSRDVELDPVLSSPDSPIDLSPVQSAAGQGPHVPGETPSNPFAIYGEHTFPTDPTGLHHPFNDIFSMPELDLNTSGMETFDENFWNNPMTSDAKTPTPNSPLRVQSPQAMDAEPTGVSSDSEFDVPDDIHKIGYRDEYGQWRCNREGCSSDRIFTRACDLRKHWQTHERKHSCDYPDCTMAFTSAKDLRRHQASHDPEVKCPAPDCDRIFSRADNMRDHFRRIHKKDRLQRTGLAFRKRQSK